MEAVDDDGVLVSHVVHLGEHVADVVAAHVREAFVQHFNDLPNKGYNFEILYMCGELMCALMGLSERFETK